MATVRQERRAAWRTAGAEEQALVLVSRSTASIEEFERDLATITRLGKVLAGQRERAGHPMKLGPPRALWSTRRNGTRGWQLTLPLPAHVTARHVREAVEATRNAEAARVQLELLHPEQPRLAHDRLPGLRREVRLGTTAQHRGRDLR